MREGFFDYYLNRLCATNDLNTDKGRLAVLRAMAEAVHKTGNVVLIDTYAQKTALRLGVSPESVRAEFKKISRFKTTAPAATDEVPEVEASAEVPRPTVWERSLLKVSLLNDEAIPWVHSHLDMNWVQHPHVREIMTLRLAAHAEGNWQGVAAFLTQCENGEMNNLITEVTVEDRPILDQNRELNDSVLRLRNQFIDRQIKVIVRRADQPDIDDTERVEIRRQLETLGLSKREPLKPLPGSPEEPF